MPDHAEGKKGKKRSRPISKFRCMKCGHTWEGYRVLWNPKHRVVMRWDAPEDYGPTECPKNPQEHIYVEWVNWEQIRKYLGRYWEEK
jgi:hypothetical protein